MSSNKDIINNNAIKELEKMEESTVKYKPLEYKTINPGAKNVLLIDSSVYQNDVLFNSTNTNTFGIKYSIYSNSKELKKLLEDNFSSIDRIGFAFDDALMVSKQFLDGELFFNPDDLEDGKTEFSSNMTFVLDLIKQFNISNVDYLVCNGLKHENWVKYFNILKNETGVSVGASDDETGNLKYGGDWVMESTNENVKNIYWDSGIFNYSTTLATSIISASTTLTNADLNNPAIYTWPITINGGTSESPIIVTFGDDITLNSSSQYFIIGSEYITIDGDNFTVIIDGVTDYPGLVQNGLENTNGFSNITIENINISTLNNSIIAFRSGWLCHSFFGSNSFFISINNCHSDAQIGPNEQCGFICGRGFGQGDNNPNSSNCKITNCSTTCNTSSKFSGIIVGIRTGQNGGFVNITNCYSTGEINSEIASGICGQQAAQNNGTVNITNCCSTGKISGVQASGICGIFAGLDNGTVNITNCYSTGEINSEIASGICGQQAAQNNGTVNITNCYSSGAISGLRASGICGESAGFNNGTVNITNCYSIGEISGVQASGICGLFAAENNGTVNITNCYSIGEISGVQASGICGQQAAQNNGTVNITNCYSLGAISNDLTSGICGILAGIYNGTVNITNCYSSGAISGSFSGGIAGPYFGFNSNNLNKITNCYSLGDITGDNAGGICGCQIGYNDNIIYTPNILIDNCYTLGNTSGTTSGSICGGDLGNTYTNQPTVNINNCYTLYEPIVSSTLQITPIQTNTYVELNNTWNDSNASTYLTGTPQYNSSGLPINPVGTVWADIDPDNNTTPWIFATLGYSPYTTELVATYDQTINSGNSTVEALETSGHTYTIIAINNSIPSNFSQITINSSTGQITTSNSTPSNTYLIKVLKQSNYVMTDFSLTVINKIPSIKKCEYSIKLKCNEKFVIRLDKECANLVKKYIIIKKPKYGTVSISSKKIVYIPDKNYTGKNKFILQSINIFSGLNEEIVFKIKISK